MNLNDSHEYYNPYKSVCSNCKWFKVIEFSCKAFPDGIPLQVLSGEKDHNQPLPDQGNTIIFKAKTIQNL